MNDNSVKKDIWLVVGGFVFFYLVLVAAGWADVKFGLTQAYTLVDAASLTLHVFTASALVWILKRLAFKNTLGKAFGKVLDNGWGKMDDVDKAKWSIGVFVVLFSAILLASK